MQSISTKIREMPHKGVGLRDTLTTPTREDSTHPQEETTLLNSPICREGADKIVERCILEIVVLENLFVIDVVN